MKFVTIYCSECSTRSRIEILTQEDIRRDPMRPRGPLRCPHCKSLKVEVRE